MGKIAITTAKYLVSCKFEADGVIEKPDLVGAIFGQTEGLLGDDLELRELQRTGRIGRIEVNVDTRNGKAFGTIDVPSSLSKEETALIAASLETIDRVGPCEARLAITKVSDVRSAKRKMILDRAKDILKGMIEDVVPDSVELSELVKEEVRIADVVEYGPEKLPAGPTIDQSDAIIVCEGRADVVNLLRNGIKNVIAINGTSVPKSVAALTKEKTTTVFLDGDRGGDLILKELFAVAEVDFVARAPDGKEVEELTKKELLKCLRSKVPAEQERSGRRQTNGHAEPEQRQPFVPSGAEQRPFQPRAPPSRGPEPEQRFQPRPQQRPPFRPAPQPVFRQQPRPEVPQEFLPYKQLLAGIAGTHEAKLLDASMTELGSVPARELGKVLLDLAMNVNAIVMDGVVTQDVVDVAAGKSVKLIVGTRLAFSNQPANIRVLAFQS